jgi:DnaJ domain
MKNTSKYFDSIRVSGNKRAKTESPQAPEFAPCEWKGCAKPGRHKAPKGRGRDGEFFLFCVEHVRQYNATYNYFDGMSDDQVEDFRKDAATGHRPTWKVGANAWAHGTREGSSHGDQPMQDTTGSAAKHKDPHAFFAQRAKMAREEAKEARRKLKPLEKKSLDMLQLKDNATQDEIKARYKELVKEHHPDANGGDPRSADKLRDVIQAYNLLKQAGLAK